MSKTLIAFFLLFNCLVGTGAIGASTLSISDTKEFCFTAGTQIVVGKEFDANDVFVQYVTVNIEDMKVGDLVYSYDTITGTTELKEVTAVFVRESDHINYLTIVDENENVQVIETTDSHPFWVVTDDPDLSRAARGTVDENGIILYHENIVPTENGFWVEAKDLLVGDVFLGTNGELSTLVDIERVVFPEGIKVYNFTVDGNHNYFVIAKCDEFGQTSILVHNSCLRANMIKANGGVAPKGMQAHHDLPRKYKKNFEKVGLNIDDAQYGRWVGPDHQKWSHAFNLEWKAFFGNNSNPSKAQILSKMEKLRKLF
jgi:hypothetical protein